MTLVPGVLWAQRKDCLYMTIDLQDSENPDVKLTNDEATQTGKIAFTDAARSHATGPDRHNYALNLDLYGEINPEDSKISIRDRSVFLKVAKKEAGGHWPRLLKQSGKAPQFIKVDWDKWVDEDEEEENSKEDFDMGDLQNFSNFSMPEGMEGMGGGDDSDDEEDLPDLEK